MLSVFLEVPHMKIKNILSNLFLFFAALVLILAFIFIRTGDKNDHSRFFFNLKFDQTTSGSMEPFMKINSIVIVTKASFDDISVGDVICFQSSDRAIAHRVTEITPSGLRTKGDNNRVDDATLVLPGDIIGKCVLVFNFAAYFIENLNAPNGFIKVVLLPILILIIILLALTYLRISKKEADQQLINDRRRAKSAIFPAPPDTTTNPAPTPPPNPAPKPKPKIRFRGGKGKH